MFWATVTHIILVVVFMRARKLVRGRVNYLEGRKEREEGRA